MADVKALVSELLQLLVADVDLNTLYHTSPSSRYQSRSNSRPSSGYSTPPVVPENSLGHVSKQDLWSRIDELLFPYMSYNMKVYMVPPERSSSSSNHYYTTTSAASKKQTLLDSFIKANITSEAACTYSADHLLSLAVYEVATKELLLQAGAQGADFQDTIPQLFPHDFPFSNKSHYTSPPDGWRKKNNASRHYNLPGVGIISSKPNTDDDAIECLHHVMSTVTVHFRRLSRSRVQACCTIPSLPPISSNHAASKPQSYQNISSNDTRFDFIWESTAIAGRHNWKLRRFGFADSDDEEHYWRPWEPTLEEAEADYHRFQQHDYKAELARLDVSDIDWDSMTTSSTTPTDDTLSTNSWPSNSETLSLPAINNSNIPSKNNTNYISSYMTNGVYYDQDQSSSHIRSGSNHTDNSSRRHKHVGKVIGGSNSSNDFYFSPPSAHKSTGGSTRFGNQYKNGGAHILTSGFTAVANRFPKAAQRYYNQQANQFHLGYGNEWGHDDHHNHYESLEVDYEDDYSYKQSHPVFQHPISNNVEPPVETVEIDEYPEWDDEDDLFGVCHSMAATATAASAVPPAPPLSTGSSNGSSNASEGVKPLQSSADNSTLTLTDVLALKLNAVHVHQQQQYQQPANATAAKTQPVSQPLLQRVCDGPDDDEAAYWDRYEDMV